MKKIFLPSSGLEYAIIVLTTLCVLLGLAASFLDMHWFERVYVVEDGFIEYMTVIALLGISCMMFYRYINLYNDRDRLFKTGLLLMGLLGIFGAGEEMSWGQRVFNVQSPAYFLQHNAQQETNVHNIMVSGKKINKIVFSKLLLVAILIYLLVLPLFYNRYAAFRHFADVRAGIPIPKLYHVIFLFFLMLLTWASPSHKRDELLEFGGSFAFLLIFLSPQNRYIYARHKKVKKKLVMS